MNVDHTNFSILMEYKGRRFKIDIATDGFGDEGPIYVATGPEFKNLAASHAGFGISIAEAVQKYLEVMDQPFTMYRVVHGEVVGNGIEFEPVRFEPINP